MRFLICGMGSIGRRHLRNLLALGEQDIVLLRTGKSTLPDDELEPFPNETDLAEALGRWSPDAVLIANPTSIHLETALTAAEAGCDLLIEKPISHSLEGVEALLETVRRHDARALVGFQFRFHPGLRRIKAWLEADEIGRPISARAHWGEYLPDWHPWEDYRKSYAARRDLGGGVVLTLCHPLDYLVWLLGEPDWVQAEVGTYGLPDLDVEDTAEILLGYDRSGLASVHLDYIQRPPSHSLEIIGTSGLIRWRQAAPAVEIWRSDVKAWEPFHLPEGFERNDMFLEEMRHFLRVVRREEEPVCDLEQGLLSLKIALAAKSSSAAGRRILLSEVEAYA